MTPATPLEATTIKEAAEMLAKRIVLIRLTKQAAGLSDYVEPYVNKATEFLDKTAPQVGKFYSENATPIHAGLGGAALGAAMGGLSGLTSPDEDRRNPGRSALMGGLAGGAVGGGLGLLAQHGPALKKLFGASKSIDTAKSEADASGGLIRQYLPPMKPDATDPTRAGLLAQTLGGDYAGTTAKVVAPAAIGIESGIGFNNWRNAHNPLTTKNIRTGASEFLGKKDFGGLASTLNVHPNVGSPSTWMCAPDDIAKKMEAALTNLQTDKAPFWGGGIHSPRGMGSSYMKELGGLHGPPGWYDKTMTAIGNAGMKANAVEASSAGGMLRRGAGFGGRMLGYAALPALASYYQPPVAPVLKPGLTDLLKR
jgi:hypothetical protein